MSNEIKQSSTIGVEQAAKDFAFKQIPDPNPNDAPYTTTGDTWENIKAAFIAGSQWASPRPKIEYAEGEDDMAFDFHKANEPPTAVNGDDECEHPIRRREYYRDGCFKCYECNKIIVDEPKAAAPKADDEANP